MYEDDGMPPKDHNTCMRKSPDCPIACLQCSSLTRELVQGRLWKAKMDIEQPIYLISQYTNTFGNRMQEYRVLIVMANVTKTKNEVSQNHHKEFWNKINMSGLHNRMVSIINYCIGVTLDLPLYINIFIKLINNSWRQLKRNTCLIGVCIHWYRTVQVSSNFLATF